MLTACIRRLAPAVGGSSCPGVAVTAALVGRPCRFSTRVAVEDHDDDSLDLASCETSLENMVQAARPTELWTLDKVSDPKSVPSRHHRGGGPKQQDSASLGSAAGERKQAAGSKPPSPSGRNGARQSWFTGEPAYRNGDGAIGNATFENMQHITKGVGVPARSSDAAAKAAAVMSSQTAANANATAAPAVTAPTATATEASAVDRTNRRDFNQFSPQDVKTEFGLTYPLPTLEMNFLGAGAEQVEAMRIAHKQYTSIFGDEVMSEARNVPLVARWLQEAVVPFDRLAVRAKEKLVGKHTHGVGDFIIGGNRPWRNGAVVEVVRRNQFDEAKARAMVKMRALFESNYSAKRPLGLSLVYGIVTNSMKWIFLRYDAAHGTFSEAEPIVIESVDDEFNHELVYCALNDVLLHADTVFTEFNLRGYVPTPEVAAALEASYKSAGPLPRKPPDARATPQGIGRQDPLSKRMQQHIARQRQRQEAERRRHAEETARAGQDDGASKTPPPRSLSPDGHLTKKQRSRKRRRERKLQRAMERALAQSDKTIGDEVLRLEAERLALEEAADTLAPSASPAGGGVARGASFAGESAHEEDDADESDDAESRGSDASDAEDAGAAGAALRRATPLAELAKIMPDMAWAVHSHEGRRAGTAAESERLAAQA